MPLGEIETIQNTSAAEAPPEEPLRSDGERFRYELIAPGGQTRTYADTYTDLLSAIIPDYEDMDEGARLRARLMYAVTAQVHLQAVINNQYPFEDCTPEEQAHLTSPRNEQPDVAPVWEAPVPIVLVDSWYADYDEEPTEADLKRRPLGMPRMPDGGVGDPESNIWWIFPEDEEWFIKSLHNCGHLIFGENLDAPGWDPGEPLTDEERAEWDAMVARHDTAAVDTDSTGDPGGAPTP